MGSKEREKITILEREPSQGMERDVGETRCIETAFKLNLIFTISSLNVSP